MAAFYTGFDWRNRKNGYFKIGETGGKTPAARLSQIRANDAFQCLGYILMPDASKPERLAVEAHVRLMMDRNFPELTHTQNDHYLYQMADREHKYTQVQVFADAAISYAIAACEMYHIAWTMGTKQYKR